MPSQQVDSEEAQDQGVVQDGYAGPHETQCCEEPVVVSDQAPASLDEKSTSSLFHNVQLITEIDSMGALTNNRDGGSNVVSIQQHDTIRDGDQESNDVANTSYTSLMVGNLEVLLDLASVKMDSYGDPWSDTIAVPISLHEVSLSSTDELKCLAMLTQ